MQPIQLFDPASSSYTYLLFDPDTREAVIIDPVDEQLERDLAVLREHGLRAGVVGRNPCPCGPHHQRRAAGRACRRAHGGARRLRHRHGGGAAQARRRAAFRRRAAQGAAHARPHRRQHELSLARPCLHGRHPAHQWLRANGFPVGQRRGLVPQPDGSPVSPARRDRRSGPATTTRGAAIPPSAPRKPAMPGWPARRWQNSRPSWTSCNLPKPRRLDEAVPANRRARACATTRERRRPSAPRGRRGLCRRRRAAAGLRMVAKGRCGAGGRAHRCRARMGRLRARRRALAWKQWPGWR